MPLQRPEADEIVDLADSLGIHLTGAEARIFTDRMKRQLDSLEEFLELRIEEERPPLRHLERDPGRRPTAPEDPLNAFIRKCVVKGAERGPLAGRTIGLKDHIAVAGVPMSNGSYFLDGYTPDFDATVVTRLLDAGATIVGKMNMEDFSFGGPGVAGVGDFGRPLNPHNPDHVTGGSSSGAAAAVVAGYIDIALGGDQGGSIRIPAAWSGCVGLKATHGLIPHSGVFGLEASVDYVGPMTRTIEDTATVLQCIAGRDGFDPRQASVPAKLPDYVGALGKEIAGVKVGLLAEGFNLPGGSSEVEDVVNRAIGVLKSLGADLIPVSVPLHKMAWLAMGPIFVEGARAGFDSNFSAAFGGAFMPSSFMAAFGRSKRSHSHELPLNFKLILLAGVYAHERLSGKLYAKSYATRPTITAQYRKAFEEVDLLVMPTCPITAPTYETPKDHLDAIDLTMFGGGRGFDIRLLGSNTSAFNFTGHPAISIPCGNVNGLPVGLQLVAPHFREDVLIRVAHAFQRSVDWESFFPENEQPAQSLKAARPMHVV
jgi:amidase